MTDLQAFGAWIAFTIIVCVVVDVLSSAIKPHNTGRNERW